MDVFRNTLEIKSLESISAIRVQKDVIADCYIFILDDNRLIDFRLSRIEPLIRICEI